MGSHLVVTAVTTASAGDLSARLIDHSTVAGTIFLYVGMMALIVPLCVAVIFVTSNWLPWLFLRNTREYCQEHKTRLRAIMFLCMVFLFFVGRPINQYLLPNRFHPVSWVGNLMFLLLTGILGWFLLKPSVKRTLILSLSAALFVVLISAVAVLAPRPGRQAASVSLDALGALGYITWVPANGSMDKSGVTYHDPKRSCQGINIYSPRNLAEAYLMDTSGRILHKWSANLFGDDIWVHVEMAENGDLLTFVTDKAFIRLDWDSNIKWTKEMAAHHDIAIDENDDIHVLTRKTEIATIKGTPVPIYNNCIVTLSRNGEFIRQVSLFSVLKEEFPFHTLIEIYKWLIRPANLRELIKSEKCRGPADLIHANTIEVIAWDIDDVFKKGNILFCARSMDMIGVIDMQNERLLWSWGPGELEEPHHPTLLENGNILIFDNGVRRRHSRVVELNPHTNSIVWEYKSEPVEEFYSFRAGASQRLPNGNTLITNSYSGQVFEVTEHGDIVWEFYNPEIKKTDAQRSAIYRMMRFTESDNYERLKRLDHGRP